MPRPDAAELVREFLTLTHGWNVTARAEAAGVSRASIIGWDAALPSRLSDRNRGQLEAAIATIKRGGRPAAALDRLEIAVGALVVIRDAAEAALSRVGVAHAASATLPVGETGADARAVAAARASRAGAAAAEASPLAAPRPASRRRG